MKNQTHPRYTQQLIGHQSAWSTLIDLYTHQTIHPCWLLSGQRGVGKSTFAYHLARYILTRNDQNPSGLGASIVGPQIANRSYPNLFVMEILEDEDGKQASEITIDQARTLKNFLMQKPSIPGWRVVIVDAVDELNRSAANALLKILEEPPTQTLILMACHSLGRVLPTIRSRSQKLVFHPLYDELVSNVESSAPQQVVEIAQGSLGVFHALQTSDNNRLIDQLSTVIDYAFQNNFAKTRPILENLAKQTAPMDLIFWVILQHIYQKTQTFNEHTEHWLNVWEKMNEFLMLAKSTHLDRLHTLTMCCIIIQKPHQNLKI